MCIHLFGVWILYELAGLRVDPLVQVVAQSTGHLHVHVAAEAVLAHLGRRELAGPRDFFDLVIAEADVDVLGLEVGVDDLAHAVHVIKADQALLGQLAYERERDAFVLVALNDLQEVDAEDLEDHDEVLAVRAVVDKRIQKLGAVR